MRPSRLLLAAFVVCAVVLLSVRASHTQDADADATGELDKSPTDHRAVNQAAPGFRMTDTSGKEVRSEDYRTKRYVMFFLSTRSLACTRTAAALLAQIADADGLPVIAVVCDSDLTNADGPSAEVMARRFKEKVIGRGGPRDRVTVCTANPTVRRAWGERLEGGGGSLNTVPTIAVVDTEGKIESCVVGEPTASDLKKMINQE